MRYEHVIIRFRDSALHTCDFSDCSPTTRLLLLLHLLPVLTANNAHQPFSVQPGRHLLLACFGYSHSDSVHSLGCFDKSAGCGVRISLYNLVGCYCRCASLPAPTVKIKKTLDVQVQRVPGLSEFQYAHSSERPYAFKSGVQHQLIEGHLDPANVPVNAGSLTFSRPHFAQPSLRRVA